MTKRAMLAVCAVLIMAAAFLLAAPMKPKSVVHVISVQWKSTATPAQIDKAIKGVETMNYPGLKNVWTRAIKMQLPDGYKSIFVMEFESEDALKKYADSPAQKAWYELYMPIREESRTSDITN
jgi:antibiotic biosynthesis monooxygenase (ABM) superfamily enzyme